MFETNVLGLIRVTRAFLPQFRRQRSGNILMLSSVAGLVGRRGLGLLQHQQVRGGGIQRGAGGRDGSAGREGDDCGAGTVPHRFSGAVGGGDCARDSGV